MDATMTDIWSINQGPYSGLSYKARKSAPLLRAHDITVEQMKDAEKLASDRHHLWDKPTTGPWTEIDVEKLANRVLSLLCGMPVVSDRSRRRQREKKLKRGIHDASVQIAYQSNQGKTI